MSRQRKNVEDYSILTKGGINDNPGTQQSLQDNSVAAKSGEILWTKDQAIHRLARFQSDPRNQFVHALM